MKLYLLVLPLVLAMHTSGHSAEESDTPAAESSPLPAYPRVNLAAAYEVPKDQLFMKVDTTGKVLELHTIPNGEDGQEKPGDLNWFHAIAVAADGSAYAGDIIDKRVQKFVRK